MQYKHVHFPDSADSGLQGELDHKAREGWRLHTLVATGRYGEGVRMVFERDKAPAAPEWATREDTRRGHGGAW